MAHQAREYLQLSRNEAAQRIASLLDELVLGSVTVGHDTFRVPADVHLLLDVKPDGLGLALAWEPSEAAYRDPEDEEDRFAGGAEQNA